MPRKFPNLLRKFGNVVVIFALILVFSLLNPAFLSVYNFMNIIRQIAMMGIVSVGFTFVLIGGGLDLSVSSQIAFMNICVAAMMANWNVNPVIAVLIGICLTTLIGLFNGYVISKTGIPPLIATLAMQTVLRGASYIISNGYPIYGIPDGIKYFGQGYIFKIIPFPGLIFLIAIVFGVIVLNKTYLGRHFYALGSNAEATRLAGINIHFTRTISYTILGFLTGVAGLIMLGRVGSGQPNIATNFEMNVLTACVIGGVSINGGRGTIAGTILGVIIIGILNNGMSLAGANEYWQMVITGTVLFAVVIFDSLNHAKGRKS